MKIIFNKQDIKDPFIYIPTVIKKVFTKSFSYIPTLKDVSSKKNKLLNSKTIYISISRKKRKTQSKTIGQKDSYKDKIDFTVYTMVFNERGKNNR